MDTAIVISGFGGQGLLLAGQVLATAAMREGREVLWIPSYGPEMRGGAASCTVLIGDEPVGSPVVDRLDVLVALTSPSLVRHAGHLGPGSLLVVDSSLVSVGPQPEVEVVDIPCTQLARAAGSDKLVSMVALGAMTARRPIVAETSLRDALAELVGAKHPELLAADRAALHAGGRAATELRVASAPAR